MAIGSCVTTLTHRSSARIRRSDVTRSVEVSEVFVSRLAVAGSELVGKAFGADAVDGAGEVVIGDGSVPGHSI